MVRLEGLEPPRPKALEPKSSVSTNFTTAALEHLIREIGAVFNSYIHACQAFLLKKSKKI